MVYRYESDEDAFLEYPRPGSDPSVPAATPPPPAGPSPSRFPTPSLPPPVRSTRPAAPAPAPTPAPAPPPQATAAPAAPRATIPLPQPATGGPRPPQNAAYRAAEPFDLPRTRRDDRRRGGRVWQALIGGTAVLVLLALCGLAVATLLQNRTGTPQAGSPTGQPVVEQSGTADGTDLDSRDTDQLALTAKEVFPGRQLVVTDGQPAYDVLKTNSSGSCAVAASGEIAELLARLGCNQVVRATLRSPDGKYLLTTGLFNLTDVASAQRARDRIRQLLDERQGRFRGMTAGDDTGAVAKAAARVGWQVRGHYIAYCLVTRADGERIASTDAKAREILYDLIEVYLNRGVLERRANGGVASQPTETPTDGITGQDGTHN
ncbi:MULTISPECIES: hypothetical protein [Micromonospora]|uniref:Uncharacterized protein n=1 Tax=Micromonospora solifontis TaxID=2487138 RepID=A0ABX9WJY6_9ACTN|nr:MULTISPECIES: hypothetical protein [Micromonospora]NES12629.1 hypothetical protein [Micromonospora sp. PPF5-17B]NES36420.1 hypothetical protein [Micromonospora solifontis]NES54486.1 hypothetical protein [Micromonospora sp. PPF5-6]RNL99478.1 hypothetical protein EFE23_09620 [Micromonospora solifontis]